MTSVSAGHIILTPTQPIQRERERKGGGGGLQVREVNKENITDTGN